MKKIFANKNNYGYKIVNEAFQINKKKKKEDRIDIKRQYRDTKTGRIITVWLKILKFISKQIKIKTSCHSIKLSKT